MNKNAPSHPRFAAHDSPCRQLTPQESEWAGFMGIWSGRHFDSHNLNVEPFPTAQAATTNKTAALWVEVNGPLLNHPNLPLSNLHTIYLSFVPSRNETMKHPERCPRRRFKQWPFVFSRSWLVAARSFSCWTQPTTESTLLRGGQGTFSRLLSSFPQEWCMNSIHLKLDRREFRALPNGPPSSAPWGAGRVCAPL